MLSRTLDAKRLSWPVDWSKLFNRDAPLLIEIGFGDAEFLMDMAGRRPEANILGVEVSLPSLRKAERKAERYHLSNLRLVHAPAQTVIWALCSSQSIQELYANFPDPWPKAAHHHRRLINDRFLELLAGRLVSGGRVDIATDHTDYAKWIERCLTRSPYFEARGQTPFITKPDSRLQTKYDRKALIERRESLFCEWQRNRKDFSGNLLLPKELPMPHIVIHLQKDLQKIAANFEARHWSTPDTTVRLIELYRSDTRDVLLVDTFVKEPFLEQRLMLALTRRGSNELLLHQHEVGHPRPTAGVHLALRLLAEWLVSQDPGARVRRDNLQSANTQE